eukprot:scaffold3826_cov273-Chaetoceros_neogracile.AAC.3
MEGELCRSGTPLHFDVSCYWLHSNEDIVHCGVGYNSISRSLSLLFKPDACLAGLLGTPFPFPPNVSTFFIIPSHPQTTHLPTTSYDTSQITKRTREKGKRTNY